MKPIGTLIREEFERQGRSIGWFARKLCCDRSNVYRLFQRDTVDTGVLTRVSLILHHDFFADLSADVKERFSSQDPQHYCCGSCDTLKIPVK